MITLYHAPFSRSSAIVAAVEEMDLLDRVQIRIVDIRRQDGSGGRDPANPHPDGKVPALDHDGQIVTERPAILSYLSEVFPDAPAIAAPGSAERGAFLTWLAWYGDVMEPVLMVHAAKVDGPIFQAGFRGVEEMNARIADTLSDGRPYLLKQGFTVADLLVVSPYTYFPDEVPEIPAFRDWVARVTARASMQNVVARDTQARAA
ncbi:glutathione S-transferase family protein [Pelagovum pacificum]|uniref:Glutathione S-transferase family protein n=2 Tax=Pelagovum pacificum TaxID=2588711 RepID=A0A5C5GGF8_9RHOB|nr:glutathione S-transferase family protein [Pelagovum pacificum]QQA43033.1 glutathione S-transferase family protein [Pelagovum pacificum]TNY33822.1 glutathione S-transferase family protein [Pelagovum pacificum]